MSLRSFMLMLAFGLVVSPSLFAEHLTVQGSGVVAALMVDPHRKELNSAMGGNLIIVINTSGKGLKELDEGKAHVAMLSTRLEDTLQKEGISTPASSFQAVEIGQAKVVAAVQKDVPIESLSRENVSNILNGTISNWQQLGGPDLPITVVTGRQGSGLRSTVEKELTGGNSIRAAKLKEFATIPQAVNIAALIHGAITITPQQMIGKSNLKPVSAEPLFVLKSSLVTKGAPSEDAIKFINALKSFSEK